MPEDGHMYLGNYHVSENQLSFYYGIDNLKFNCTYWFEKINLLKLIEKFGLEFFEKILFHAMCFEANKLCSLKPVKFYLNQFEKYYTEEFEVLWKEIFKKVWGQWRYQNNQPNYDGPKIILKGVPKMEIKPLSLNEGKVLGLLFIGGGKDSLASIAILEQMKLPYDALIYTNTIYGSSSKQVKLSMPLLNESLANEKLIQYVFDDFMDSPVLKFNNPYDIKELIAAETPSSMFSSLFYVIANNYTHLIFGHEKSADFGNLTWKETGEIINHQWGKSHEAQILINTYINKNLISNLSIFSTLKPLYDTGIFQLIQLKQDKIKLTHSCNVEKPWCCKCAKCAYVWLCLMAYFPTEIIESMFNYKNLLNDEDNLIWFRQLLGLEDHLAFECVGKIEEVRLAFEILKKKGYKGIAMDLFISSIQNENYEKIIEDHFIVDHSICSYPENVKQTVLEYLEKILEEKKNYFLKFIKN